MKYINYVFRFLGWLIVIAIALPIVPLTMSLCAGIYLVVVGADRGERGNQLSVAGGAISIVISAVGIGLTYLLVRLGFWLFGGS
jgi:hypothetical protein